MGFNFKVQKAVREKIAVKIALMDMSLSMVKFLMNLT